MQPARWFCCVLSGLILLASGCISGGSTRKNSSAKIAKNVISSTPELSSRNQSLLALYSAEIEAAADQVISESPSYAARRQALEWKAEAIPILQTSLLNTDPIAAVLNTWTFIFQMNAYMERLPVKQALGAFHPIVTNTVKNMDTEMERIVRLGAPAADVVDLRRRVSAWADAHPIQASLVGRQSLDPDLIRKAEQSDLGTLASIKVLGESIGDLTARLDSYNVYIPKQARWQAELLLGDLTRDPQVSAALSALATVSHTAGNMDRVPEMIGQAREAVNADFETQRLSAQAFLSEQRLQTLDALQQQRIATIAAFRSERLAATADMRRERQVVLDAIRNDELAALTDVQGISEKGIQEADARGRDLIDHFFVRTLELMLLAFVLCSLVAWVWLRRLPSKAQVRDERFLDRAA